MTEYSLLTIKYIKYWVLYY